MIQEAHRKIKLDLKESYTSQMNDRVQFFVMDPFSDPKRVKQMIQEKQIDTVLIDIGGNRDLESVVLMVDWIQKNASPRVLILKSEAMIQKIREECSLQVEECNSPKRIKRSGLLSMDSKGYLVHGQEWFQSTISITESTKKIGPPTYIHPFKAPISLSPDDSITPICRYHNYHKDGCKKGDQECEFDHLHCHWCKGKGHIALECSVLL